MPFSTTPKPASPRPECHPTTLRILFDQGPPVPLRRHLSCHEGETAYKRGWAMFFYEEISLFRDRTLRG